MYVYKYMHKFIRIHICKYIHIYTYSIHIYIYIYMQTVYLFGDLQRSLHACDRYMLRTYIL